MAHIVTDRVADTTTTTGTGAITVSGTAATGYRTFSAAMSVGDTCYLCIASQTANEWETSLATYSSSNTLTRTTILKSSNANAAVSFSSGTKDVFISLVADRTATLDANSNLAINGAFWTNSQTISADYTVPTGQNAGTFGPATINSGITVTVSAGSTWTIV